MDEQCCGTCGWYDAFTGACCNAGSENRAEFMDGNDSCDSWKGWGSEE